MPFVTPRLLRALVAGGLLVSLLAGCATPAETTDTVTTSGGPGGGTPVGDMVITGLVESAALVPLAHANVSIEPANLRLRTDANGRFTSPGLASGVYIVSASMPGYLTKTLAARPEATSLQFILPRAAPTVPYNVTLPPMHGVFECASDQLIGSGPCDLYPRAGGAEVFHNESSLLFRTDLAWKTLVLDLVFDPEANPGLEGMRFALRGQNSTAGSGTYEQYGRFTGTQSFTSRVEPGGNYTDGTGPVPANVTDFQVDVYPLGRAYHDVCHPDLPDHPAACFTGIGAGVNVRFDLYVTIFYVEPAPEGFTLLSAARSA